MNYPKVLVVANNSFSLTNSNGRTLGGFFDGWPKECLAQFCISTDGPNYDLCDSYYCVTDSQALRAFLGRISIDGKIDIVSNANNQPKRRIKKNVLNALIRNTVWNSGRWKQKTFIDWCQAFKPEVILLQSGDSYFMLKIATDLAKEWNIPLVIYNSESYYFKDFNFMSKSLRSDLLYKIYLYLYKRQFRRTMAIAAHSIYSTEELKNDYDEQFSGVSTVLYTSSSIGYKKDKINNYIKRFAYLGNLGHGRDISLLEIADALAAIDDSYKLEIYGVAPSDEVIKKLSDHPNVKYMGFVDYDTVKDIMYTTDILFHAELFSEFTEFDIKYGFSTKIADSLSCGANFLIYAPPTLSCTKYLMKNKCAWVVTKHDDLMSTIIELLNNREKANEILSTARRVAMLNHDSNINKKHFQRIISNEKS